MEKNSFPPQKKCVLTLKDHFQRQFYFPHFRGVGGGVKRVWKKSTLFIFLKASLIENSDYHTNKLSNVHALHCTIVLYIVP